MPGMRATRTRGAQVVQFRREEASNQVENAHHCLYKLARQGRAFRY
jgi:hypothetical protein